ncbi:MAG: polysaccharide deacetylase family protein [Clostridia bacterium]|nr:polysaccharide deacetylase family protein [Clostridia bacterium]
MKFGGKMKAITFSYDDGVTQDLRVIEMFNRYGLKGTFNLNSGGFGGRFSNYIEGNLVYRDKVFAHDVRAIYEGHEVASHTLNHPDLTKLSEEDIVYQIEEDRKRLSDLVEYDIVGLAYPCGYVDGRVVDIIKSKTGIKYARTVNVTHGFDLPSDLYRLDFSTRNFGEGLFELAEEFINLKPDEPKILSIWGHAYEFDWHRDWHIFERFCNLISGHSDIFYGTNREVFL